MRIIAFANANSGPAYHRIIMPLMLMPGPDVFITNSLKPEHFEKGCDLFMYNRVLPEEGMPALMELKKKYGFKICVDVDDYWHLDEHHILYDYYRDINFASLQIRQLQQADIVLTTHSRLANEISDYGNINVHVCPNAIPRVNQFDIEREPHHVTRLFWQGGVTHEADIGILQRPLGALGPLSPKIKMVMAGFQEDEEAWQNMAKVYTADFKHQYKIIPGVDVKEYYHQYKHADICLVPLVKSQFNSFKSNLKVLEAANLGLPVIASEVDPYLDMPLLYCKTGSDWIKHIARLVKSKKRQKEAGQELAEFCQEHFNFHKINNERRQILEHVATKAGV